jgi:hypothetical protein
LIQGNHAVFALVVADLNRQHTRSGNNRSLRRFVYHPVREFGELGKAPVAGKV